MQRKYVRGAQDKEGWKSWGFGEAAAASKLELARARASQCALTQKPLSEPIVCCRLGNLFNKDDLVLALQAKAVGGRALPSAFKHIKGLNDVTTLRFTKNPEAERFDASAGHAGKNASTMEDLRTGSGERPAQFMCPVTRLEFNGRNKFCAVFQGGGEGPVLAERCLRRMKPEDLQEEVGRPFTKEECVQLCPDAEEYQKMRKALVAEVKAAKARKKLEKAEKKKQKRKITDMTASVAPSTDTSSASGSADHVAGADKQHTTTQGKKKKKKKKLMNTKSEPGVNTSTAFADIGRQVCSHCYLRTTLYFCCCC